MSQRPTRSISDTELEILKILWQESRLNVAGVRQELQRQDRSLAYTTVQTLLNRLEEKGYAASEKVGRSFTFFPIVDRKQFLKNNLDDLADRICAGSETPLLMAFAEGRHFSAEDIRHFRQLLDKLEAENEAQSQP